MLTPRYQARQFLLSPIRREPAVGFTLIEMLAVLGVIAILLAFVIPAVTTIAGGRNVTSAAFDISGVLESSRTYAIANNTYVWVGFFEEDGSSSSTNPATSGTGRVVISAVASADGTRYGDAVVDASNPAAFGTEAPTASPLTNQVKLISLLKLKKLDGMHLASLNDGKALSAGSTNTPPRPPVQTAYQVGNTAFASHTATAGGTVPNPTVFTSPLTIYGVTQTPQYTFTKIIEFDPQGAASKMEENTFSGQGPQTEMEIALQPTHGSVVPTGYGGTNTAAAAVQIEGTSGQVRIYRQ